MNDKTISTTYDAETRRWTAVVTDAAGVEVWRVVKAKKDAAVWHAEMFVSYSEPVST